MRLLKQLTPVLCLIALVGGRSETPTAAQEPSPGQTGAARLSMARPGPREILWAAEGDKNYAYGPSRAQRDSLAANAAPTATIQLLGGSLFDHPQASAAFTAAADVWAHTIVSPSTIRVSATFEDMGSPNILGSAGPTAICGIEGFGFEETWYAAALADKLIGSQSCAALAGETSEITVIFNSTFDWDFNTSGIPVPGKINFMTVVLHELGHGLGFYGSATASSLEGGFGNPCSDTNPDGTFIGCYLSPPDIYDRFVATGSGAPLLGFASPSETLATLAGRQQPVLQWNADAIGQWRTERQDRVTPLQHVFLRAGGGPRLARGIELLARGR